MTILRSLYAVTLGTAALFAQTAAPSWSPAQQKGFDFLLGHQKDGVFAVKMGERSFPDPGFTGLALAALQSKPLAARSEADKKVIEQGLTWLLGQQNEDGSFGQRVQNYTTCAAVMALARWQDERTKPVLQKAQKYILAIQHCETNGSSPADVEYGGIGYGSKGERSDLSNVQFALQALRDTGLPANDDAFRRAVVFLQRTQNLPGTNDLGGKLKVKAEGSEPATFAVGKDGGAVYYPGESPAGAIDLPDGTRVPRSYGSMTYALLKCYLLCGLPGDDPRVKAAVQWIGANWTLVENPGADPKLGEKTRFQGLFYYYLLLAQALDASKVDKIATQKDGKPAEVEWRKDLRACLEASQLPNGAWLNDKNGRWYENLDILCTCYAMLALGHCN
ncbi:MAG: terpene cyclase/mutase family protein [Planctomycetes bacterium]|nr:terpene cyclase/mutase family protein [Planctomycetota bacterium]